MQRWILGLNTTFSAVSSHALERARRWVNLALGLALGWVVAEAMTTSRTGAVAALCVLSLIVSEGGLICWQIRRLKLDVEEIRRNADEQLRLAELELAALRSSFAALTRPEGSA